MNTSPTKAKSSAKNTFKKQRTLQFGAQPSNPRDESVWYILQHYKLDAAIKISSL